MHLKAGDRVTLPDGEEVGHVERLVIDPQTMQATDLVVRHGRMQTQQKLVPLTLVETSAEDGIHLKDIAGGWDRLTDFEEVNYHTVDEQDLKDSPELDAPSAPVMFPYPPYPANIPVTGGAFSQPNIPIEEAGRLYSNTDTGFYKETRRNIPDSSLALKEGAQVFSADGAKVGTVEQVFTSSKNESVTHLLIAKGFFLKERKLIPFDWVQHIYEDEIHLGVNARFIEHLPDYKA